MVRIEVATPADILAAEDKFAALVVASLAEVAARAARTLGADIVTAATVTQPEGPDGPIPPPEQSAAAVEDIGIIPALWTVQVTATLMPELQLIYELSGVHVLTAIGEAFPGLGDIPAVSGLAAAEQRLANAQNRLVGIGDMLWEQARAQLLIGFSAGEDIGQLRDRVQHAAGVSAPRAETIARTEVISSSNAGSIDQVRAAGLVGSKEWLDTPDERTRCTHHQAGGQTVDLDGKFQLGGGGPDSACPKAGASYADYPGDPTLPAAEAINCRCSIAFDVDIPQPLTAANMVNGQQLNGHTYSGTTLTEGGGLMPWHIVEDSALCPVSRPYAVVKDATGQVEGCHTSRTAATEQMQALYSSEKANENVTAMAEQPHPEAEHQTPAPATQRWEGTLAIEGVETGDGRMFALESLTWRDLPVPLMYQKVTSHGGVDDVTVNVGSIDEIWRDGNLLWGRGRLDMEDPNGVEVERKMRQGFLRGVSIDADSIKEADVEFVWAPRDPGTSEADSQLRDLFAAPELTRYHKGRISAATVVNIPAFQEAKLFLVDAATGALVAAGSEAPAPAEELPAEPVAEPAEAAAPLAAAAYTIEIPDLPPAEYFEEPAELPPIGALWVTAEGRVFGLVGAGDTAHRSFRDRRITIPMGNVDYTAWMNRPTIVQGGKRVATGVITMNCGHASPLGPLDPTERMKHYDNSCSIAAVVAVGESKKFGAPWVSGVLMPMEAEQVQRFMACQLSGDWPPHREKPGWKEFVAALAVPVPGFARATKARVVDDVLVSSAVPIRSWEEYQASLNPAEPEPVLVAAAAPVLTDEQRAELDGVRDRLGLSAKAKLAAVADRVRTAVGTAPRPAPVPGTFEGAKKPVACAPCAEQAQRRRVKPAGSGDRHRAELNRIVKRARSLQVRAGQGPAPPVALHLPGQHPQKNHGGGDGLPDSDPGVLRGVSVLDQAAYEDLYGDVIDEEATDLGNGIALTTRYFKSSDAHAVLDLPDGKYQVMEEMSPDGMRALADNLEEALDVDLEGLEPDSTGVVWDTDSREHDFYVAVDEVGDIRLRMGDNEGEGVDLSASEAEGFMDALRNMADGYDDEFNTAMQAAGGPRRRRGLSAKVSLGVIARRVRAGVFHLPNKHPQEDHAGGGGGGKKAEPSGRYKGPAYTLPAGVSGSDVDDLRSLMSRNSSDLEDDEYDRMEELQENLPKRVVQRVEHDIQIQKNFDEFRTELAPGEDADKLKADMVRQVREATADKPIGVRVTERGLESILAAGRFKTQYETDSSGGRLDVGHRNMVEGTNFGLPDNADPASRPVYGYVLTDGVRPSGVDPESGVPGEADALSQYGKFQVILKPEVRDRTTAMFGDSMNQRVGGRPSPINDPAWESFTPLTRGGANRGLGTLERDTGSPDFRKWQYVEAQVHGGVSVSDIAEVVLPGEPNPAVRDALEKAKVPWRVLAGEGG